MVVKPLYVVYESMGGIVMDNSNTIFKLFDSNFTRPVCDIEIDRYLPIFV